MAENNGKLKRHNGAAIRALRIKDGLKPGQTAAPVAPVPDAHVEAALPHLRPPVRPMARLQRLTGRRPGEVCRLTLGRVDRAGPVWVYRSKGHKSEHYGKVREVWVGPQGQDVLLDFLAGRFPGLDEAVLSPARDREARFAE